MFKDGKMGNQMWCTAESSFNKSYVLFNGPDYSKTKKVNLIDGKASIKSCQGGSCDNLPIFVLPYEMNFVYDLEFDSQRRPLIDDPNDPNALFDELMGEQNKALIRSDFPKNNDTFETIKKFAYSQQVWYQHFFDGWEKIQNHVVDYDLKNDLSQTSWLGYSFLEKSRKYLFEIWPS